MFGLMGKEVSQEKMQGQELQIEELIAAIDGKLIPIDEVKDAVYSEKMVGDGFAIIATGDKIYACADAKVSMLFPSNHAIGLTLENDVELLIHVGIDTVKEKGRGFTCLIERGQQVKKGDVLLELDVPYLMEKGYDLTTIIAFTNKHTYSHFKVEKEGIVHGGMDIVATYAT